jgi:aerobic-type carbon monoxide dehydrogenase small subunit (CoxS/CutS family)
MKKDMSSAGSGGSPRSPSPGFSRRDFLIGLGTTAISAAALRPNAVAADLERPGAEGPQGPGPVPVALTINGERRTLVLEPRVTLLEALRTEAGLTGAKEACGRATCGACTVLLDGKPAYACTTLAIDAQGREITTIEGVSRGGLTPIQRALVETDGLQCGYCTPGFVMSLTALARTQPNPTEADVRKACSGHLCRCGSYPNIFAAALKATGRAGADEPTVIHDDHALA